MKNSARALRELKSFVRSIVAESLGKGKGGNLIIVDVQPEYASYIKFDVGKLLREALQYNRILFLWNGPDLGMSSRDELISYYGEALDYDEEALEELISRATFYDKGYGFFRDLLDHPCFDHDSVVKIVKYMLENDIRDIKDLSEEDIEQIGVSDLLVEDLEDYGFFVPDLKDVLGRWNGSSIAGGGENECLAEVEVLADAMGLNFRRLPHYIY